MPVKVVVNGIGVIGKRIAHAIRLQDDMELHAISTRSASPVVRTVLEPKGPLYKTDLYACSPEKLEEMRKAGMHVNGTLEDLLKKGEVDLVIDCTPKKVGIENKRLYKKHGVKAIFQGGEKSDVATMSFNTFVNYDEASKHDFIRVPSCNTTSLIRTLHTLSQLTDIEEVDVSIVRRGSDPPESEGLCNSIEPTMEVPSHHGPDVQTVLKDLDIKTMAVKVPTTLAHVHMVHCEVKKLPTADEIKKLFNKTPRITVLKSEHGYTSTAKVIERYRDLLRPRYDMPEVMVWEETINAKNDDVFWAHMVHPESIVIPENIDCIRAIMGIEKDWKKSVKKTDESLGI
ncbi:MAG: type II glyceraldehyde-3-phosphate dehydrogenase [Candidatus Aenigmarchaeota archaeon]|nr:type II glyceraldehyde-3-phosphate dehydrogenase [Candidatus Aenigmarchaeota archaeon]